MTSTVRAIIQKELLDTDDKSVVAVTENILAALSDEGIVFVHLASTEWAEFYGDVIVTARYGAIGWALWRADGDARKTFTLDKELIRKGIAKVFDPGFEVREDIRKSVIDAYNTQDAGDIDAEAADVIVQAAVFGEIIYG